MSAQQRLDPVSGWFANTDLFASPNFDARPAGVEVDLIVVHAISLPPGEFGRGFIGEFFLNRLDETAHPYFREIRDLRVSTHFVIDRGGRLSQFVSTHARAWHCGQSSHAGRPACNDFSVGVELEGCDEQGFTDRQYSCLGALVREIRAVYPAIADDAIVGHSDIAPGRKTDPGPHFDWTRLRADVAGTGRQPKERTRT